MQSDNEKYESNNWEILYDPKNAKKYKKTNKIFMFIKKFQIIDKR